MKFFTFINEARVNLKKHTVDEIIKNLLENHGNLATALKWSMWYIKGIEESDPRHAKLAQVIVKIKQMMGSGQKSQSTNTKQERPKEEPKQERKQEQSSGDFKRPQGKNSNLQGLKICLTGKGPYTRSEIVDDINRCGGLYYSVQRANILVTADLNSTSGKMKYAMENGIRIISYEQLYKMMNQNPNSQQQEQKSSNYKNSRDDYDAEAKADHVWSKVDKNYQSGIDYINEIIRDHTYAGDRANTIFWNKVKTKFQSKYGKFQKNDSHKSRSWYQQKPNGDSWHEKTTQTKPNGREIIFSDKDKIKSSDISYRSLLMKLHPDFHDKDHQEDAHDKTKMVLKYKGDPTKLRTLAKQWGLLKEGLSADELYLYLLEEVTK